MTAKKQLKVDGVPATQALQDLLYQLLETEIGGVEVYRTALECAQNEDLTEEWQKYLEETERHVKIARQLLQDLGLDPDAEIPAREVVRNLGETLVENMRKAIDEGDPDAAQLVAAEAVVQAETKDHMNWELVGMLGKRITGDAGRALREAHAEVEPEEDRHLYHNMGWARELWLEAMGLPAALPPPEEVKDVETAIGAARAKKARRPSSRPRT